MSLRYQITYRLIDAVPIIPAVLLYRKHDELKLQLCTSTYLETILVLC